MKSYKFELILILLSLYLKSFDAIKEAKIKKIIKDLKLRMCHPIPELGLPALDPFEFRNFTVTLNNEYLIDFYGRLTQFQLTGLSDIKVDLMLSVNSKIDLIIPSINFNTNYSIKGTIDDFVKLNGAGRAEGSVQNTKIHITWHTNIFSPKLAAENLNITFNIGEALFKIDQLIEDQQIDSFVHQVINELGLELLNDLWMDNNETIIKFTQEQINKFIGNYTINDFFQLIDHMANEFKSIFDKIPPNCKKILIET
uniref:Lipid-binding serum glycoprotein N-terminal domain-containing protein n=1 Tax=Glossina brevipalpis TaxID=37001 RepID=A0A1A9WSF0_9MUSC